MTNNNTAAAIAAEIIATTETRIELRAAELHDVDCFRQLCASAVAWLDAECFGQADDDEEHADEYRAPPHRWGAYESARASGRFHLQNRRGFFQLIS